MGTFKDGAGFEQALTRAIATEARRIVDEETEKAMAHVEQEVRRRVAGLADRLALSILRDYDVMSHADRLVITVRKPEA